MATIHAPFAPRDYSVDTHSIRVLKVPSNDILTRTTEILSGSVTGYIEPSGHGQTKVTTIHTKTPTVSISQ